MEGLGAFYRRLEEEEEEKKKVAEKKFKAEMVKIRLAREGGLGGLSYGTGKAPSPS